MAGLVLILLVTPFFMFGLIIAFVMGLVYFGHASDANVCGFTISLGQKDDD